MAFDRPTLTELRERTQADVAAGLGLGALFPRSVLQVLANTQAAVAHQLHAHAEYVALQILPDTADSEHLERFANLFGLARKAAAFAKGSVKFTGLANTTIPAGTKVLRTDGVEYATDAEALLPSMAPLEVSVAVTATLAGTAGNASTGVTLTLISPISGVDNTVTIETPGLAGGLDQEDDADLLVRVLQRLQEPPKGGSVADYKGWALEVAGVTRAFALPLHFGAGTVGVTFLVDDDPLGPIPDAAKVAEVQAYIDDPARRPVTAGVTVFAPSEVQLNPDITLTPDTTAVRDAVEASLEALLRSGVNVPGGTLFVSHIREAISIAEGEVDHKLNSPTADIAIGAGEIVTLGTVTWST